jgi:hypothetical protein
MPIGSDGQPKLSELLDTAISLANSAENKEAMAHIVVMLNTIATHFTDYSKTLESAAAMQPVPTSEPAAPVDLGISNRELRRRVWKADNPEYANARNSVVDKAIQAEIRAQAVSKSSAVPFAISVARNMHPKPFASLGGPVYPTRQKTYRHFKRERFANGRLWISAGKSFTGIRTLMRARSAQYMTQLGPST